MRKFIEGILALTIFVCLFLMIGFAGALERDMCTMSEYLTRSGVTLAVMGASGIILKFFEK